MLSSPTRFRFQGEWSERDGEGRRRTEILVSNIGLWKAGHPCPLCVWLTLAVGTLPAGPHPGRSAGSTPGCSWIDPATSAGIYMDQMCQTLSTQHWQILIVLVHLRTTELIKRYINIKVGWAHMGGFCIVVEGGCVTSKDTQASFWDSNLPGWWVEAWSGLVLVYFYHSGWLGFWGQSGVFWGSLGTE